MTKEHLTLSNHWSQYCFPLPSPDTTVHLERLTKPAICCFSLWRMKIAAKGLRPPSPLGELPTPACTPVLLGALSSMYAFTDPLLLGFVFHAEVYSKNSPQARPDKVTAYRPPFVLRLFLAKSLDEGSSSWRRKIPRR